MALCPLNSMKLTIKTFIGWTMDHLRVLNVDLVPDLPHLDVFKSTARASDWSCLEGTVRTKWVLPVKVKGVVLPAGKAGCGHQWLMQQMFWSCWFQCLCQVSVRGHFLYFIALRWGDCFILTQQATMHTDGGMSSYTCTLRFAVHVHLGQHTCCSESRFGEVFDNHLQVRRDRCLLNGGHLQLIASLPN